MAPTRSSRAGFTLMEILVTLAIIAVNSSVVWIGSPSTAKWV